MSELAPAMILSLQIAACAIGLVALSAIPLAFVMCHHRGWVRTIVDACLTIPLVLPPTVVGYILILLLGRHGLAGACLDQWFGYSLMFHWHGAVLAAAFVAFPLVYLPARSAFASVDRDLEDVARLSGAGSTRLFWHVNLPLARRGIAAGMALAFARALGEFGATIMILGDTAKYRTLPLLIYGEYGYGQGSPTAALAVLLLCALSLAIAVIHNRASPGLTVR